MSQSGNPAALIFWCFVAVLIVADGQAGHTVRDFVVSSLESMVGQLRHFMTPVLR